MPSKRDYYEVLGVPKDASEDDIRKAFRRLARQYHPDINKEAGATDQFKEANEAYEVLSDTDRRAQYDRFGHDGPQQQGFGGGFGQGFGFEDIFESFFGGMRQAGHRVQHGSDLRYDLTLSFEESIFGVEKTIEVPRQTTCTRCGGSRGEPGTRPERCPACNGSGEVRRVQQSLFGQFVNVTICERCQGEGNVITSPCQQCHGRGSVRTVGRLAVTVPPGIDDSQQIRLSGEGEAGPNGTPNGDLYVVIHVAPHPQFKRQGTDLLVDMTINVAQAALGTELGVPTAEGVPYKLKIPAGTQYAKVFRIRERGVPHLRGGGRGDLMVRVYVTVPQSLTSEQRRLFEELNRALGTHPNSDDSSTGNGSRTGSKPTGADPHPPKESEQSSRARGGKNANKTGSKDKGLFGKVFGGE